jgi:hypothetical protein
MNTQTPHRDVAVDPRSVTRDAQPFPRRRRAIVAGIAVLAALALVAVLVIMTVTDDDTRDQAGTGSTVQTTTELSATTSEPDAEGTSTTGAASTTSPAAESLLEDGRHPVFVKSVDVAGRTVEFDLIQFLTGDEAIAAHDEDHPDDPGGPPNDYYIVNDNPRLRRLPVTDDVEVIVLDWEGGFEPQTTAFADLPALLAAYTWDDTGETMRGPFWLTVENGTITAIEEQYIP